MKKALLILAVLFFASGHAFAGANKITMGGALGQDITLNGNDITNFSSQGSLIAPLAGRLETAAAFTLEYGDRGSIIFVSTGSDLGPTTTITFSSAAGFSATSGIMDTMLIVNAGAGTIVFQSAGTESVRMSGGATSGIGTQYNQASLIFYDASTVYITGGIE